MRRAVAIIGFLALPTLLWVEPAASAKDKVFRDEEGEPVGLPNQVWVVKDEDGNLVFTDTPGYGAIAVNIRNAPPVNPNLVFTEQEVKFDGLILAAAQKYKLDPYLVKAVIRTESRFDPDAISDAGAQGLMQLMPETAERFHVDDLMDPAKNIEGGVQYLHKLLDMFKGDAKLAVAAYNCGERLVLHEKKVPDIPETVDYVQKVQTAREEYRSKGFTTNTSKLTLGHRAPAQVPRVIPAGSEPARAAVLDR